VCLEAAIPALLSAILDCAKHAPREFISDVDLMTVYLEQIGIANEVGRWWGLGWRGGGVCFGAATQLRLQFLVL
jgi:hypothetical protein